jgi:hypothetical protein
VPHPGKQGEDKDVQWAGDADIGPDQYDEIDQTHVVEKGAAEGQGACAFLEQDPHGKKKDEIPDPLRLKTQDQGRSEAVDTGKNALEPDCEKGVETPPKEFGHRIALPLFTKIWLASPMQGWPWRRSFEVDQRSWIEERRIH